MTLAEFVVAVRAGQVVVPYGLADGARVVEGAGAIPPGVREITAEAYHLGVLDAAVVPWDEAFEQVSELLRA